MTGVNLPNMGTTKLFLHDNWHFVTSLDVELGVGVGERGRGGGVFGLGAGLGSPGANAFGMELVTT